MSHLRLLGDCSMRPVDSLQKQETSHFGKTRPHTCRSPSERAVGERKVGTAFFSRRGPVRYRDEVRLAVSILDGTDGESRLRHAAE